MRAKLPANLPPTLEAWIVNREIRGPNIYDRTEIRRTADRYNTSPERIRGLLRARGWTLEKSQNGVSRRWVPPERGWQ